MTQVGAIVLSIGIDDDPEIGSRELVESLASIDPPSVPRLIGSGTAGGVRLVVEPEASTLIRWLDSVDAGDSIGYGQHGRVLRDLTLERNRQIGKGWTLEHDDEHGIGHLVTLSAERLDGLRAGVDPRRALVEAATMLVAAIEAFDRRERAST